MTTKTGVWRDALTLARVTPSAGFGSLATVGYMQAQGVSIEPLMVSLVFVATVLAYAAANAFNDAVDVRADVANGVNRPLATGRRDVRFGWVLFLVLGCTSLVLSATFSVVLTLFELVVLAAGVAYSLFLKSSILLGNLFVASMSGVAFCAGCILASGIDALSWSLATAMIGFMLPYEVLKTIRDESGDRLAGYATLSTTFGYPMARNVFSAITIFGAGVAVLPAGHGAGFLYIIIICAGVLPAMAVAVFLLWEYGQDRGCRIALRVLTCSWIPGIVATMLARY